MEKYTLIEENLFLQKVFSCATAIPLRWREGVFVVVTRMAVGYTDATNHVLQPITLTIIG